MKPLHILRRMLASAALLCACAQSQAGVGFCTPDAPSLASTQSSSGGVFTIDIAANAGGCPSGFSSFDGALTKIVLPYFSDANASVSAPTGWTWQIVSDDLTNAGHGAGALVFSASSALSGIAPHATLSGFLISSAFAGVQAPVFQATTVGILTFDYRLAASDYGFDIMPLIPGSPMALEALDLPPAPVPEPSAWALLALGLIVVGAASKRNVRGAASF